MEIIEVIILAIVQALTEFLPVSSSGHLILVQELFDIESTIGVDVMLHFGTLLAIIVYFWSDLMAILNDLIKKHESKLALLLLVATVPAVVVGGLFGDFLDETFRNTSVVVLMMFVIGVAMILERKLKQDKNLELEKLSYKQVMFIGVAQLFAFIPGTSRSGITMLAGRSLGLDINRAARFSFLMGIPVIFGATISVLAEDESRTYIQDNLPATIVGVIVSAGLGYLAIAILLKIVRKWGLAPFGWYRVVLSAMLAILLLNT
jgi:undecaprenyl-diphosphatase